MNGAVMICWGCMIWSYKGKNIMHLKADSEVPTQKSVASTLSWSLYWAKGKIAYVL